MNRRWFLLSLTLVLSGLSLPRPAQAAGAGSGVAIKGYDPVAYFTESRPVIGIPRYEYEWDETIYWFASAHNRDLFVADPDRYAPQFAGYCTASLARGKKVVADPKIWTIQDGRLYLFAAPAGPDLMREDPKAMEEAAKQHFETGS